MDVIWEILKAVLQGVVQGITEWLPISSTGHLILVDQFLPFSFSQEFIVTPATLTDPESEIPVNSSNILDVKQLVLQELSLEIPAVLLCKEDCQGLCPKCGRPKEENCGCQLEERVDPRLLILKQLLDNDE